MPNEIVWKTLPRSERATIGRFSCDVWQTGDGARYSVLDNVTGRYVKGGKCASMQWAREVSTQFTSSLVSLCQTPSDT